MDPESFASEDEAAVGDGAVKVALGVEVVFQEVTVEEFTVDKAARRESRSTEDAVSEAAVDEVHAVEQSPVPVEIFEGASNEFRGDMATLHLEVLEVTVDEVVVFPWGDGKVLPVDSLRSHMSLFRFSG